MSNEMKIEITEIAWLYDDHKRIKSISRSRSPFYFIYVCLVSLFDSSKDKNYILIVIDDYQID